MTRCWIHGSYRSGCDLCAREVQSDLAAFALPVRAQLTMDDQANRRQANEQAHALVTQWLARPEPPNTGELIELATILEGSKQPEDGREDV